MKANTEDQPHLTNPTTDRNQINITMSAQDRSQLEDSNASFLHLNDPLNITTFEDVLVPRRESAPSQEEGNSNLSVPGKINKSGLSTQKVNIRPNHSRLEDKEILLVSSKTSSIENAPAQSNLVPPERNEVPDQHSIQIVDLCNSEVKNKDASLNIGQVESPTMQNSMVTSAATHLGVSSVQPGSGVEAKVFLRKRVALFATLIVSSVFLWRMMDKEASIRGIIVPFYVFFSYLAIEGVIGGFKTKGMEAWQKREHKLDALNAIGCIIALLIVDLKLFEIINMGVFSIIPLFLEAIAYLIFSRAPTSKKIFAVMFRVICAVQTLLIMLKIDGLVEFEWAFALIVCLVYLGFIQAYCLNYGFFILLLFYLSILRGYKGGELGRKIQFLGLLWHFLYYGLSLAVFLIIVGISYSTDPEETEDFLKIAAKVTLILNAVLFVSTIIVFKPLAKFTCAHFESKDFVNSLNGEKSKATIIGMRTRIREL